ncbi:MAG: sensor histidine kinase [Clostridium sp.]|uniref:sensor histidine kinase n=1 Tax=Clostridium sp. TaxID=1506 RepID=UPI003F2B39EA
MRKKVVIVFMIVSVFSILFSIENNIEKMKIFEEVVFIISFLGLEVLFSLLKNKNLMIGIIEVAILVSIVILKLNFMIYFVPVLISKVFKWRKIAYSILISIIIMAVLDNIHYLDISIYIVIISLYLNEIAKRSKERVLFKEKNKDRREENHRIRKELHDLERYLEQNKIIAGLKERNFMAQKLHDHLGHRITSSLMQLEVTKETIDKDTEISKKYLNGAMENLRVGMDEIRKMLKGVKPKEKLLGIENIREQIFKFQYSSRMKTSLKVQGDLEKISFNLWGVIEENLREALTNAAKYSEGKEVIVSIFIYNKILRVEIRDDGKGSDFESVGLGLNGIKERTIRNKGRVEYFNDNGFVINTVFEI